MFIGQGTLKESINCCGKPNEDCIKKERERKPALCRCKMETN